MSSGVGSPQRGRERQRRRTRNAIIDAATALLAQDKDPSMAEIADAADVSRRTVYLYFPTLEQLLIDATVGATSEEGFADLWTAPALADDVEARVEALARWICRRAHDTMPLGRTLIRLTLESSTARVVPDAPRRGYRRVGWIEEAVAPLRGRLPAADLERLVSGLAIVLGWEALIILQDVRGLSLPECEEVMVRTSRALVRHQTRHG